MKLDGPAYGQLTRALADALQLDDFDALARHMHWERSNVVGNGATMVRTVHSFIEYAETKDAIEDLIAAAQGMSPTNRLLGAVNYVDLVRPERQVRPVRSLSAELQDELVEAILDAVEDPGQVEEMLAGVDDRAAARWEESRTPAENLRRCLVAAADGGWLLPVVAEASKRAPDDPRLRNLECRLTSLVAGEQSSETWLAALERCQLDGGFFMINRRPLRASMARMKPPDGNRVLVVRGDPRSGLSHSLRLIYYLGKKCSFSVAEVDLEEAERRAGPGNPLTPRDIAVALVKKLGYTDMEVCEKRPDKQWSAWIIDFKDDFEERARLDERPMTYLVLDAFHKVHLTQPSVDMVSGLSKSIGMYLPNLRLVLVGFTQDLPVGLRQARLLDETSDLTDRDLMEFFAKAYKESRVSIEPSEIALKTRTVLGGRRAAPPGSLDDLADKVARELPGI